MTLLFCASQIIDATPTLLIPPQRQSFQAGEKWMRGHCIFLKPAWYLLFFSTLISGKKICTA
jgi:hypothetical protein